MPIEIKELHIKAVVQDGEKKTSPNGAMSNAYQVNAIVAECVEQVLNIIKEKAER
ncbi:MAG TPA: DUF5908 family protein [Cyclobacteriaceae bacterium]|nr:DUF5908 family protein [Cyclobacteriaceae bacterium]